MPIPAPRRLVRTPAVSGNGAAVSNAETRSSRSAIGNAEQKTGKEVILAEVRGQRIPLSTDSHGRDLLLIPPGSDGFNPQEMVNTINTLSQH